MLRGRSTEQARIDRLLSEARAGNSGAIVLRGEPGIGKTALLEYAAEQATGMTVLTATGTEAEASLPFAGLHLLLRDALSGIGELPDPQRHAMDRAFGRRPPGEDHGGQSRLLVGFAALSLLAQLTEAAPVVCLVDDVQWLDVETMEALQFVARRLGSDGIAMIFGERSAGPVDGPGSLPGVPELQLDRLLSAEAAALLDERFGDLSPQARYRVLAESAGNPLALLELPVIASEADFNAVGADGVALTQRLRTAFIGQTGQLPESTRTALVVAAADGTGEVGVVLPAAIRLGAVPDDLARAERAGLIQISGGRLRFRHPLVRAAVLDRADFVASRAAHGALAEALTAPEYADRRAHHLAETAMGPDEDIAAELERTAERAGARYGHAAVAVAYERSARLSADQQSQARRYTLAAAVAIDAGQITRAGQLATRVGELADPRLIAMLDRVRAEVQLAAGAPRAAHQLLLDGAANVADIEPAEAIAILSDASHLSWHIGDPGLAAATVEGLAAVSLPPDHPSRHLADVITWLMEVAAGLPTLPADRLHDALAAARDQTEAEPVLALVAAGASMVAGQDIETHDATSALVATARAQGQFNVLVPALTYLAQAQLFIGRHRDAEINVTEARDLAYDTGQSHWLTLIDGVLAYLAALTGDDERCRRHADASATNALASLQTAHASWALWARSMYDLGLGRPESALVRLEQLGTSSAAYQIASIRSAPDQIEAAVRIGRPDRALEPLRRLESWADRIGSRHAAVVRRCRAILAPDAEAEEHFTAAITLHGTEGRPFEQARTELLYGEWLRRVRRNTDARIRLESALATFERVGALPWAERARAEIHASGGPAPNRSAPDALAALTPQESRIVQLAAGGQSNKEIAAQLFLSPRTVGYHLYKAYPKLGVMSRAELSGLGIS